MKVVYFSFTGHCRKIASSIGDHICEKPIAIKPLRAYPDDAQEMSKQAKKEIESGETIELERMPLNENEEICLVFPSWHRRLPQIVVSFIKEYKPSRIVAVVSSYEGEIGNCDFVLRELCPNHKMASVPEGKENDAVGILIKKGLIQ